MYNFKQVDTIRSLNLPAKILQEYYNFDSENEKQYPKTITNKYAVSSLKPLTNTVALHDVSKDIKLHNFISVILSGGRSTRFNGRPKVLHKVQDPRGGDKQLSLLELNILQVINFEKKHNLNVPVIIFDDFYKHEAILKHIKENKYFGKTKNDFTYVKQTSGPRYIVSDNAFKLFKTNRNSTDDSFNGTGHFCFNAIMRSDEFKHILKEKPEIEYLVVSNCDNLGQKYFEQLLYENSSSFAVVCDKEEVNIDGVYVSREKNIIMPYFLKSKHDSVYGFTGTCYIRIVDLLSAYGYHSVNDYLNSEIICRKLSCRYWPIYKNVNYKGQKINTLHIESPLAEISRFINLTPVLIERNRCFFPTKKIEDLNRDRLDNLAMSIKKYEYL